ncbi:MAG: rod shape-determining protein MreC [Oscillospiraceae bacterium]|nr:rod shape-determining protein MreC [Oscillospiraceae bacterium]
MRFFKNKYVIALIVATLVIFITMSIFGRNEDGTSVVGNITGVVVGGVQRVLTGAGNSIGSIGTYFSDVNRLTRENEEFRISEQQLRNDLRELAALRDENERLRRMLNLDENNPYLDLEAAKVIAQNPGNWYNTFTINKGTRHGIAVRQPVITAGNELVGYISAVGTNWARVTAIVDPTSAVGAMVVRSRDMGVVEGDVILGRSGQARLSHISRDTNIIVGDYVETSGMGGMYPRGILIGQVLEIRPEMQGLSQYAIIQTAVDFGRLTEVFVIKNPPDAVSGVED